ncbi:dimethylarginine dimethylaminohydrolase family protein [Halobacillus litoralis]|uniref:dimethylarginine dimethylaminohydrolase family protein n=1 Tax=Halobacillus litoralis TaxID=45668 RepID=UPI002493536F|nr:arginine deiminase family protein [Halobacillus litoralis]
MQETPTDNKVHCRTEYSPLSRALVVKPSFMKITEVINETQKYYKRNNINIPLALQQHEEFVDILEKNDVEVLELPAESDLPEQVFTRDIAFVIHNDLFLGSMNEQVREKETARLEPWLHDNKISLENVFTGSIEGGDVMVDGSTIWVGRSGRTSARAVDELQARLPSFHVEALSLNDDILHLDCVFNIIGEGIALVYPPAFTSNDFEKLKASYHLIPVTNEEQFRMGPNVLTIGHGKVISLPANERLNRIMQSKGFQVIPVEFSEIIKSGGSFRCCTLPLRREE